MPLEYFLKVVEYYKMVLVFVGEVFRCEVLIISENLLINLILCN